MHLFFPLLASLLYVTAVLFFKQAATRGVGPWRTALVCNSITALAFYALWPLGDTFPGWHLIGQPLAVAALFVLGQVSTFLALEQGDVSIATPVMGIKLILVAFFTTWLLSEHVRPALWIAATLSVIGIALLHRSPSEGRPSHQEGSVRRTIFWAVVAGAAYALFDVLIMKWAPAWGAGRFLPITMTLAAGLSLFFLPLCKAPLRSLKVSQWRSLLGGSLFMASQAMVLVTTLAIYQDGTAVNVIYNLRGLWSVIAVWFIGHWFGNVERELGARVMRMRLVGASALCAAVVLVFL